MKEYDIPWCAGTQRLKRIVIHHELPARHEIRQQADRLAISIVTGQVPPLAGDLWIGLSPSKGWGGLEGETMWARTAEVENVLARLKAIPTPRLS